MKKLSLSLLLISSLAHASGFLGGGGGGGGTPAIGGGITGGTRYSILFVDPANTIAEDPTLFGYDIATNRFCLGCDASAATNTFHLLGTARFESLSTGIAHLNATGVLSSSLVVSADITDANVTNAKLADMAQSTIKGRAVGAGTGVPVDLTATQATAILDVFGADVGAGGVKGLVPATIAGDATKYLKGDGTWATVAAGGVTTVGAIDGQTASANGQVISGTSIYAQSASVTRPGLVNNTTQSFSGAKTFTQTASVVGSADTVQLTVQGNATQTSNLVEIYTSGFSSLLTFSNAGNMFIAGNFTATGITGNYFTGPSANAASTGVFRFSNGEGLYWRDAANAGNKSILLDGSDVFQIGSATKVTGSMTVSNLGSGIVHASAAGLLTSSAVSLTADVSGILPLANGGTNKNMTAANGGIVWTDADSQEVTAAGTAGQVLTSGGAATPTWGYGARPQIFGSRGTPRSVVAATGITSGASHMSTTAISQKIYVEGSVAGDSVATTITAGTIDGQDMILQGRNNANTVSLTSATTNVIVNGSVTLGQDEIVRLSWDGTNWVEMSRSN